MTPTYGRVKIPAIMRGDVVIIRLIFTAFLVAAGYLLKPVGEPGFLLGSVVSSQFA